MQVDVLSLRDCTTALAQGCLIEFEDVIIDLLGGTLIKPTPSQFRKRVPTKLKRIVPSHRLDWHPPQTGDRKDRMLVLIAMTAEELGALSAIPRWREHYGTVCAYIFDAFTPVHLRIGRQLDHLFIPFTHTLEAFREAYRTPVSFVPMAADVQHFGEDRRDRSIDLIGYGRQHEPHSNLFAQRLNRPGSGRTYYHTTVRNQRVKCYQSHRRLFWQMLRQSHVALAYDGLKSQSRRAFPFSFVGQRWFECLAAGCAIAGWRPTCPETDLLMNWQDATIELPDPPQKAMDTVIGLLEDPERLGRIQRANHAHALLSHDWRHRLGEMFEHLDLPEPTALTEARERLIEAGQERLSGSAIDADTTPRPEPALQH